MCWYQHISIQIFFFNLYLYLYDVHPPYIYLYNKIYINITTIFTCCNTRTGWEELDSRSSRSASDMKKNLDRYWVMRLMIIIVMLASFKIHIKYPYIYMQLFHIYLTTLYAINWQAIKKTSGIVVFCHLEIRSSVFYSHLL